MLAISLTWLRRSLRLWWHTLLSEEVQAGNVVMYSHNIGAEVTTAKNAERAFDHNALFHAIWSHALRHNCNLWMERAPSKFNISESPSRFSLQDPRGHRSMLAQISIGEMYQGKVEADTSQEQSGLRGNLSGRMSI